MQSVARPDDIDAFGGGLAADGDGESDYGQIDEELAAKIMEDLERQWGVALNEEEGDGIEQEQEQEEQEQEQEQEHERMELEV
jgi:hypothetical protein